LFVLKISFLGLPNRLLFNFAFFKYFYCNFIAALLQVCWGFLVYDFQAPSFLSRLYCNLIAVLLQLYGGFFRLRFSSTKCVIATLLQLYCSFVAALSRPLCFTIFQHKVVLSQLYCSFIAALLQHVHIWPQQIPFTYVLFYHSFVVAFIVAL
jgi:hypothetical protein